MRIHSSAAWLGIGLLAAALGCGNYGAPNNPPMAPDSSGDSTAQPPNYHRN
ncbi:MAG TPA: hypothetical protein VFG66_02365 [Gemmatimonadales bacterium]|nr:hypothetical protein [Gemmatimonadales bacterium]